MVEITVSKSEEDIKLVKFVTRYLKKSPDSFVYKMLRKKNIVLNNHKADGSEKLKAGDSIKLYLSDDTLIKFGYTFENQVDTSEYKRAFELLKGIRVIYEEGDYLCIYKPVGILSQKASDNDVSANEWLIGYLLSTAFTDSYKLASFKPSVLNRLDRNTDGLVICSKTYKGGKLLSEMIKKRIIDKKYRCLVSASFNCEGTFEAYHYKDDAKNTVYIYDTLDEMPSRNKTAASLIKTGFKAVSDAEKHYYEKYSDDNRVKELEVTLYTGKTHQIRAHLAHLGFPIAGDVKYGGLILGENMKYQALSCITLTIPADIDDVASDRRVISII